MAPKVTRREFLTLAAGATALGLGAGSCSSGSSESADAQTGSVLPRPADAPFDTVVVLMMENRSFDHLLGWLPGRERPTGRGSATPTTTASRTRRGRSRPIFRAARYDDPDHTWQGIATQYADGRCDGFLKTRDRARRPLSDRLLRARTICRSSARSRRTTRRSTTTSARCWVRPGRIASTSSPGRRRSTCTGGSFRGTDAARPCTIETAIFDRVREAGLTAGYYYHGEPMTGLFASKKYDDISYPDRSASGRTRARASWPNVVFVDPDYTDARRGHWDVERLSPPTAASSWRRSSSRRSTTRSKDSPQWGRMVFVLNFDEHGGFFDHVPPPECQDDTVHAGRRSVPGPQAARLPRPGDRDGPVRAAKIEKAGPYEHCSILKMIEWRWGLEPMTLRDRTRRTSPKRSTSRSAVTQSSSRPSTRRRRRPARRAGAGRSCRCSRKGWVEVSCEAPEEAVCRGRLVTDDDKLELASCARSHGARGGRRRPGDATEQGRSHAAGRGVESAVRGAGDHHGHARWRRVPGDVAGDPPRSRWPLTSRPSSASRCRHAIRRPPMSPGTCLRMNRVQRYRPMRRRQGGPSARLSRQGSPARRVPL